MKRLLLLALPTLVLAGCATVPTPQTRDEWMAIHSRTYPGKTPEEVTAAAEKVLKLADHDFRFDYPPGQLIATRPWLVYAVIAAAMGTDYWKVETTPVQGGTKAVVQISRAAGMVTPSPTAYGDVSVMSSSMPGQPIQFAPPYEVFWHRVEHQLGLRQDWLSCDDYKHAKRSKAGLEVLCSVNTDDKPPPD